MSIGRDPVGAAPVGDSLAAAPADPGVTYTPSASVSLVGLKPYASSVMFRLRGMDFASATVRLVGVSPAYVPSAAIRLRGAKSVTPSAGVRLSGRATMGAVVGRWAVRVVFGGVDVSGRLTGRVRVIASRGKARVAEWAMVAPSGALSLPAMVGREVLIEAQETSEVGGVVASRRIFTGVVDLPVFDQSTRVVRLTCTDRRQQVIGGQSREWLLAATGGRYHRAVFGDLDSTYDYAEALMSTVPAALDLDAFGVPRVTPWATGAVAHVFDDSRRVDGSLRWEVMRRMEVRNTVRVGFEYRFSRLRARVISAAFSQRGLARVAQYGMDLMSREMIESALGALPWALAGKIRFDPVPWGTWNFGSELNPLWLAVPQDVAPNLAQGFRASLVDRWAQTVTERFEIEVVNSDSVSVIGTASEDMSGAQLEAEFDAAAWEADATRSPVLTLPAFGDVFADYGAPGSSDRAEADAAMVVLVMRGKTRVLASHRGTRVFFSAPLRADLDTVDSVEVVSSGFRAIGGVETVEHVFDFDKGQALTAVEVAISGLGSVGLQVTTADAAPAAPADALAAPGLGAYSCTIGEYIGQVNGAPVFNEETMIGFSTNAKVPPHYDPTAESYPLMLSIGAPEVEAAARDAMLVTTPARYEVAIPQDVFEVTVP